MYVLIRPGPYVCGEWVNDCYFYLFKDMGGLPHWLLKEKGIKLRTNDARYINRAKIYLS
jgi:beta-galactosidase